MMKKLGFIGAGNMGSAILNGILKKGSLDAQQIAITDKVTANCAKFAAQGVCVMPDNQTLAEACECVLLAIKPAAKNVIATIIIVKSCNIVINTINLKIVGCRNRRTQ